MALVTGANSGIGKAIATGLAKRGGHVTLVVRDLEKGRRTVAEIQAAAPGAQLELLEIDLARQRSIREGAKAFLAKNPSLHILVNCAGVFQPEKVITEDGLESTFATNYVAYFLLTDILMPALKEGVPSRIVNLASKYGGTKIDPTDINFEKRKYTFFRAVAPTMVARVLFTQELSERLGGSGVVVNAVHPGLVAHTQLLQRTGGFFRWMTNTFGKTPEVGADTPLWLATSPQAAAVTGKLWAKRRPIKTPGQGSDPAFRKAFWAQTEKLLAPR